MNYDTIVNKIDIAIKSIDSRIEQLKKKVSIYSNNIQNRVKGDNLQKYQYELERDNYYILKINNEIMRCELFKKRCRFYKDYLSYIQADDILNIKRSEYNFIKALQDETIFYFDSKENELKQRATIEKIAQREIKSLGMIEQLRQDRDKKYNMFLKREFHINKNKLYTFDYLNYDINEVSDIIYKPRSRRKAS